MVFLFSASGQRFEYVAARENADYPVGLPRQHDRQTADPGGQHPFRDLAQRFLRQGDKGRTRAHHVGSHQPAQLLAPAKVRQVRTRYHTHQPSGIIQDRVTLVPGPLPLDVEEIHQPAQRQRQRNRFHLGAHHLADRAHSQRVQLIFVADLDAAAGDFFGHDRVLQ